MIQRRDFLKHSLLLSATISSGIKFIPSQAYADEVNWNRTLILLELKGGNDGLNTVIPFSDESYYELRPSLGVKRDKVIQISDKIGIHPALLELGSLWANKEMAIIQGVGYPDPNLSHFRGINIWNSASDAGDFVDDGWIARLFSEARPGSEFAADGINLGGNSAGAIIGNKAKLITLGKKPDKTLKQASRIQPGSSQTVNKALGHILKQRRDLRGASDNIIETQIKNISLPGVFPQTNLGIQFQTAARLLMAGVKVPVIKLMIGGFDTHAEQEPLHSDLLSEISSNIATFATVMKSSNLWNNVAIMSYSEFGRRVAENNSSGTDHGTAAPQFVFGGKVKGGLYGNQPQLNNLENENLKHQLHFREIYASVARDWWGMKAKFIKEKSLNLFS
jgi:uncharacterized protein (DUF1501 family)